MPQFGESSLPAIFPSWVAGGFPQQLSRHPHPGTPRVDGRLRWPSDPQHLALHGRAWGRLYWQESTPGFSNGNYDNYETVYWDWWATDASEAVGWTSKTTSGRSALLRLRHVDNLPFAGVAGSELYTEYFKDEVSIGIRTLEFPDTPGLAWNSTFGAGGGPTAPHQHPTYDLPLSGNQWASIQVIPAPECYRFFDTQRTVPSPFEQNPAGMAAIKVRIHEFGWGQNEFNPGGGYTKVQQQFATAIKSDWIVRPVFHGVSGWIPSWLEYKSTFFWDPVATDGIGFFGLYYGFAIRVIFNSDLFLWTLHIRSWRADFVDPSWEIPISQSLDSGVSFLLGINGALFASNFFAAAPFESRNIEQYEIEKEIWPRFGPMGPFGMLGFNPIRVSLLNVSAFERGQELPSQGPLDMPKPQKYCLKTVASGSLGQSLTGAPYLTLNEVVYDNGGWTDPAQPTKIIVPPGIKWIRAGCGVGTSANTNDASINFHKNGTSFVPFPWERESVNASGAFRASLFLPRLAVVPGDEIQVQVGKTGATVSNVQATWLYAESIEPQSEPVTCTLVPYSDPITGGGLQDICYRVPPSLDAYRIKNLSASLGLSRSSSGDVQISLSWIRNVGRMIEDITDDPITIEANDWTSDTATNPPTIFPSAEVAQIGDLLLANVSGSSPGARGLVLNFDFEEVD